MPRGGFTKNHYERDSNDYPPTTFQCLSIPFTLPSDPRPMSEKKLVKPARLAHMWSTSMVACGTHDSDMMCHARTYWQRRPLTPIVEVSYKRPGSGGQQSQTRHVSVCKLGAIPFCSPLLTCPHHMEHCRTRPPHPFLPFCSHNKHSYKATHANDFHSQNTMRTYVAFLFLLLLRVSEGMMETRRI
jgi:hypothetical protein